MDNDPDLALYEKVIKKKGGSIKTNAPMIKLAGDASRMQQHPGTQEQQQYITKSKKGERQWRMKRRLFAVIVE